MSILALGSCANLFTQNFFQNFDGPPDASELLNQFTESDGSVSAGNADSFVDALDEAADSSRFFDELSDTDRNSLNTSLTSVYSNSSVDAATRQEAAVLAAEVTLRGTAAEDTINNVADVLTSSAGADSFSNPEDLLDQIIPAEAQGDAAAVAEILEGLATAAAAYDSLGSTLVDSDGDGTLDGPDGTNMTEVAQNAAISMIVGQLVDGAGSTDALAAQIVGGTVADQSYTVDTNDANLSNILEAGGLDGLLNA